jgi:hypothetical protein
MTTLNSCYRCVTLCIPTQLNNCQTVKLLQVSPPLDFQGFFYALELLPRIALMRVEFEP